jgi:thiol-disulfide isomerase/thioredoxin
MSAPAEAGRPRRRALVAGVAVAAGACGVLWQVGRGREEAAVAVVPVWDLRFPTPEGGELQMSSLRGRPLVLNFWATWCPPCIKELPELDRFHREWSAQGWQVVGLAVDKLQPVKEFLQRQPLGFAVGLAGLEGSALSRDLGNAQGALPFTAVFDRRGRLAHRKLGQTSYEELAAWARAA